MYYVIKNSYNDGIYFGNDGNTTFDLKKAMIFSSYLDAFNFYTYQLQQSPFWILLKIND